MNKITFEVQGEEIDLRFNISSLNTMSKLLFGDQTKSNDFGAIMDEIAKISEDNFWFAAKIIIYSGVVGYSLESNSVRPKYTFEQVGEIVGKMTVEELNDYSIKVWEAFLDALGVNMEKIAELEGEGEKKK